jgi:hypothetical protein
MPRSRQATGTCKCPSKHPPYVSITWYMLVWCQRWPQVWDQYAWQDPEYEVWLFNCMPVFIFTACWDGSPLNSYALGPTLLPLLEIFLEILLWNSFQCHCDIFFWMSSMSWKLCPFKANFIFGKQPQVIRSQIRGTGWVFHFSDRFLGHKLLDRERLMSWIIVMVENPTVEPKFRPFSAYSFT